MSAQNCFQLTKPTSFSFSLTTSDGYYSQTFSGPVNEGITNRELACTNLLTAASNRLKDNGDPVLLLSSGIPRRTLPPPYPYPRTGFGNGYSYPEYVEFGADETTVVVRYLTNPTSEELAWPTTLPALVVSTEDATPLPQVKTIEPSAYTTGMIYARLEETKKITNFIPTNYGSGAILYLNAPNDPAPSDTTIPRLFASKVDFNNEFIHIGQNDRPCSGCDLCGVDGALSLIPESLWEYSNPAGSGTGFIPNMDIQVTGDSRSVWQLITNCLNTNFNSRSCKPARGTDSFGQPPSIVITFFGDGFESIYYSNDFLKTGTTRFENIFYPAYPEDYLTLSINLTYA
jgi:hypothetical protein